MSFEVILRSKKVRSKPQNCLNFGPFLGIFWGKEKVFENSLKFSQSFENPRLRLSNLVCSCFKSRPCTARERSGGAPRTTSTTKTSFTREFLKGHSFSQKNIFTIYFFKISDLLHDKVLAPQVGVPPPQRGIGLREDVPEADDLNR